MPKKTDKPAAPTQPPLVPLTEEELKSAPGRLAKAIEELEQLEAAHKEVRTEQSAARKKLRGQISSLASQIRSQGR